MSAPLLGVFTLGILGLTTVSAEATLDETDMVGVSFWIATATVSYTHLRAHETN